MLTNANEQFDIWQYRDSDIVELTTRQIEEIERFGQAKFESLHHTHDLDHAERTVKLASYIAHKERADVQTCKLGALLHQYHPEGYEDVNAFLTSIGVNEMWRKPLLECIRCVEPESISGQCSLEAKVVFDADKLQTLGPFGLVREVVYRVETLKIDFMTAVRQSKKLQALMRSKLQTQTAIELGKRLCHNMNEIFDSIEEWDELTFIEYNR